MPTMFEKIWNRHVVAEGPGGQTLLDIDRHLLHEGATVAFTRLRRSGRSVRRPEGLVAPADHYVPTGDHPVAAPWRAASRTPGSDRPRSPVA